MGQHQDGYGIGGWIHGAASGKDNPFPYGTDHYWMAVALDEAMRQVGLASPNPTVGCVFVKDGKLRSKGATEFYGGRHGERVASEGLTAADLKGATAYVTLEPCSHFGKQPPCVELLKDLRLKRVVIAMKDPFPQVNGRGIRMLEDAGVEVTLGVLGQECLAWHLPFIFYNHYKRPLLVGKWAQTFDGHLADDEGQSKWITGRSSRAYTHFLRQKYDAIMVGAGTVLSDFPRLDVRDCCTPINRSPIKIIIDPQGRITEADPSERQKLMASTFSSEPVIYLGPDDRNSWMDGLNRRYTIAFHGRLREEHLSRIKTVYESIANKPLQSILVEGGPTLLNRLMEDGMMDVLHTFIRPSLLGGSQNRISTKVEGQPRMMSNKLDFTLISSTSLEQDIVVESISSKLAQDIWQPYQP